jgi:hypothetical protein
VGCGACLQLADTVEKLPQAAVVIRLLFVNPYVTAFDNDIMPLHPDKAPILCKGTIREYLKAVIAG